MFTRMTGDLVKAMRVCPQPIVAAIDGVCAGAGAIMAMASDLRVGTARSKTAFLFNRVGLAGCDMGACAMLPRIVGQGRASELLYTGRALGGEEGERWGFFNRLVAPRALLDEAMALGARARRRPDLRQRHHQDDAPPGVGDDDRAGDRGRGAGAGDLHADAGLHARVRGVRREAEAALRRQLRRLTCSSSTASPSRATPSRSPSCCARSACRGSRCAMSFADFAGGATRDAAWREGVNEMGEVPVLEDDERPQDDPVGRDPDDARRAARRASAAATPTSAARSCAGSSSTTTSSRATSRPGAS